MKQNIMRIIKICIFSFFFLFVLQNVTEVFYNKSDADNFKPFYDMEEKFDVLFLGTSVATSGISPLDLWNDYGIVSFNLANNGQPLPANYWALKSALQTQTPKVVVVDVSYVFKEKIGDGSDKNRLHQLTDNMPWTRHKVQAIIDLIEPEERKNYLFPVLYYHERWKELTKKDFTDITSINRGGTIADISKGTDGQVFDTSVFAEELTIINKRETMDVPELSKTYLEKIIKLCQDKNIAVLLINYPSYAQGERNHGEGHSLQKMWNELYSFAEEWDVEYVNCLQILHEIDFNLVEDLRDWRHIDVSGNEKITTWLGKKLQKDYLIPNRKYEERLQYWNDDYEDFDKFRKELMEKSEKN